eukprot:scaffold27834_cov52-Phaeocystis_antarctica.AAC.9
MWPRASAREMTSDLVALVILSRAESCQSSALASSCSARGSAASGWVSTRLPVTVSSSASSAFSQACSGAKRASSLAASTGWSEESRQAASLSMARSMERVMLARMSGNWSIVVVASVISGMRLGASRCFGCASHSDAIAHARASVGTESSFLAGVRRSRPSSVTRYSAFAAHLTPTRS